MGYLGATLTQVFTRTRSGRVSHNPDRGRDQECEWRYAPEAWTEIWEKSVTWDWDLGEAKRICALRAPHVLGGRWKSQHRKMVSLSLCRKTFKLKGNKKFRTWAKKSKVFFVFRDSYVIYVRYGHYERFAYRYEYVYFTYSYLAMLQLSISKYLKILKLVRKRRLVNRWKNKD